jgi:hypothetical protein
MKNTGGRPPKYTEAIGKEICERIADGESLRHICQDAHMPSRETVRKWLREDAHEGFLGHFVRGKMLSADAFEERALDYCDRLECAQNLTEVQALKESAQILFKCAAIRNPKVYGDKVKTEHSGEVRVVEQRLVMDTPPPGWKAGPDGG